MELSPICGVAVVVASGGAQRLYPVSQALMAEESAETQAQRARKKM